MDIILKLTSFRKKHLPNCKQSAAIALLSTVLVVVGAYPVFDSNWQAAQVVTTQGRFSHNVQQATNVVDLSPKVQPPIDVNLTLLNEPQPGEIAKVELSLKPHVESTKLEINFELPNKLKLLNSAPTITAVTGKDREETYHLSIDIPDKNRYEIYATIEMTLMSGFVMNIGTGLSIFPGGRSTNYTIREDDAGNKVREYIAAEVGVDDEIH